MTGFGKNSCFGGLAVIMLTSLIRLSIRFSGIVVILAVILLSYGGYRFSQAGLDIFPEFSPKQVVIQSEAPGLSAEQVEILVTQQIETAIGGLNGLQSIRSESIQGLSVVTARFDDASDVYRNRQLINERLNLVAPRLPDGIIPVPVPLSSSSATILTVGLQADDKTMADLRSLVDWTLVPRLLAVPGVADVNVFGGDVRQLQIRLLPERLHQFDVSFDEVVTVAQTATQQVGGGFIENANQRVTLQVSGNSFSPEQLRQAIVKRRDGVNLTLGDVAEIDYGAEPAIGAAQIMGKPGIVMMVTGQYGADTLVVSQKLETVLTNFQPLFAQQHIRFYPHLFRPADYIETSLDNLTGHLLIGGLFVLVVLYAFLFNVRTALVCASAIPLSLVTAVIVLLEHGTKLNVMALGGLAIALGEVVDDAIIDTENIFRRLQENRLLAQPLPVADVVLRASLEVRSSVVYASFIVALVFVPLLTLPDVAGRLFSPLGYSYILAVSMSLLTALTVTPALCSILLHDRLPVTAELPLIRKIKPAYQRQLAWIIRYFYRAMLTAALVCLLGFLSFLTREHQFLPELREGHFIVHTASVPGTSLQESIRVGTQLTERILAIPGVESVSQWAGRAERGADTYGSHYSEYEVRLVPMGGQGQQQVLEQLRETLARFPGISYEANSFLTERIDETIAGFTSPLAVNLYGHDLTELDGKARQIAEAIRAIPGAEQVQLRSPPGTPIVKISIDAEQLKFKGVAIEQVVQTLRTAYEGHVVGKRFQDNKLFDIAVILDGSSRNDLDSLQRLPIRNEDGILLPLGQVVGIAFDEGRYNILHRNAQRVQTVTGNIEGRDLDEFINEVGRRVQTILATATEIYPELVGSAVEQAQSRRDLILHAMLAGCAVLMLIYIAIGSLRHTVLTLANLPFSLLGGVAAVQIGDADLSIGSFVGFVTLFGITVRNSIMLIAHYRHLVEQDGVPWNERTAMQGAQDRLPAILMTALVTALAMLPIAIDSDNPGQEIMGPMAAIIIGGLVSSTLFNLLILPAMLLKFGRFAK